MLRATLAAFALLAPLALAAPVESMERNALIVFGQPPRDGATILFECHVESPAETQCVRHFEARNLVLYVSSCDRHLTECSGFSGKLVLRFHDGVTPNDVIQCYFEVGVHRGCANRTPSPSFTGNVTLTVEAVSGTLANRPTVGPNGTWHLWAAS